MDRNFCDGEHNVGIMQLFLLGLLVRKIRGTKKDEFPRYFGTYLRKGHELYTSMYDIIRIPEFMVRLDQ